MERKRAKTKIGPQVNNRLACATLFLYHFSPRSLIPLVHLALRFIFSDAIPFLDPTNKLVPLSVDDFDIVIGQLAPFCFYRSLQLLPLTFHLFCVHVSSFSLFDIAP